MRQGYDDYGTFDYLAAQAALAAAGLKAAQALSFTVSGTAVGQLAVWDGSAFVAGQLQGDSATGTAVTNTTSPFGLKVALTTVPLANGGTGATTAAAARTNLGLGGLATQNAAAASADSAPAQSAAYVQADVQAILTELRDLKTKMRTAGILTP